MCVPVRNEAEEKLSYPKKHLLTAKRNNLFQTTPKNKEGLTFLMVEDQRWTHQIRRSNRLDLS